MPKVVLTDEEADELMALHPRGGYLRFGDRRREVLRDIVKLLHAGFSEPQITKRLLLKYGTVKRIDHTVRSIMGRFERVIQERRRAVSNLAMLGYEDWTQRAGKLVRLADALETELYDDEGHLRGMIPGRQVGLLKEYRATIERIETMVSPHQDTQALKDANLPDEESPEALALKFKALLLRSPWLREIALNASDPLPEIPAETEADTDE